MRAIYVKGDSITLNPSHSIKVERKFICFLLGNLQCSLPGSSSPVQFIHKYGLMYAIVGFGEVYEPCIFELFILWFVKFFEEFCCWLLDVTVRSESVLVG
jgi:hypothetical protein